MKRQPAAHPTAPRSFLHQLAEPVPATAARLTTPRPTGRGVASHVAIPTIVDATSDPRLPDTRILDATGTPGTFTAEPIATQQSTSKTPRPRTQRSETAAQHQPIESSQLIETTTLRTPSAQQTRAWPLLARAHETTLRADSILQSTLRDRTTATSTTQTATPNTVTLESIHARSTSSQPESPLPPQSFRQPATAERRPDISVHIGTIEVRVPQPPTRTPPPAPAANTRNAQHAAASTRAAEPLARSLAWSHGLVQG